MKIGIYNPYLDDIGGGEKYMLTIAQVLSKGNEVSIFWDNENDLQVAKERFGLDLSSVKLTKNIFSSSIPTLERFFLSKNFDYIIVLSDGSIPIVLSKLLIHFQRPLENIKLGLLSRIKLARVSTFFCNSEYTKKFIDKKFKIKSRILYPPVEIYSKEIPKKNIILHVGRFRPIENKEMIDDFKKQKILISTFKEMVDEGLKNWELILCVSVLDRHDDIFKEYQLLAKGYPIKFEINKSNLELWDYYSKAKIYWHASGYGEDLNLNPELAEHFGISTVEAMGAGAVPVVINEGGQVEIVEKDVSGLVWDSIHELKSETLKLIKDRKLLKNLSIGAKKRAMDFSLERFSSNINDIIQSV